MSVHVEWSGHACFRIWRDGGPVIVMDPYTPENIGLPPEHQGAIEGDTVIVSSLTDKAHGNPGLVRGNPTVINALDVAAQGADVRVDGNPLVTVAAAESPPSRQWQPERQRSVRGAGRRGVDYAHG